MTTSFDPVDPFYRQNDRSLIAPASIVFNIDPENEDLERAIKALRVYNPADTTAIVRVTTIGGSTIDLPFPPGLSIESARIRRVWAVGTTTGLIMHGYTD